MDYGYFNYITHWQSGRWGWWEWRRAWWRFYQPDRRWSPPDYATFGRLTAPAHPHWQTVRQQPITLEALTRRAANNDALGMQPAMSAFSESTVAAALVQVDPRAEDTAYLALLRCANDEETLERLLDAALSWAGKQGCTQLVGPTGLLPAWQSGALLDHFHVTPPLHTPYNPPYLPDILAGAMTPLYETALYRWPTPADAPLPAGPATLTVLDPLRLAGDCLDLLNEGLNPDGLWPRLDTAAATLFVEMVAPYPTAGWVATLAGQPVGLALVQPDLAEVMRRAGGARAWPGRAYARWGKARPAAAGRLLLGAVAPAWRGQGIGAQLWRQVTAHAVAAGWATISAGPFTADSPGAAFLTAQGATPVQRYTTYTWPAW
jgi:GNAT superfamily N-acetyltransferase